jgi:peptidoglycan/xylan/chitin deacetylase (PgdA/CDA1 family)
MSILCYHTVDRRWPPPLAVVPEAFERHAAWLARHRQVVPLPAAIAALDRSGRPPRGMVALTFDDGFSGLFDHALPVLRRHRLPWTVFLVAGTLAPGGLSVDWVDTPPPFPIHTLSLEQVQALRDDGVEFGSHSFFHRDLTTMEEMDVHQDLLESRELLEDTLHRAVPLLAYPRGRHDARVRRAAARAGFTHAFALPERRERPQPLALPRVGIYPGNGPGALRIKTSRAYLPVRTSRAFPALRRLVRGPVDRPASVQGARS